MEAGPYISDALLQWIIHGNFFSAVWQLFFFPAQLLQL